MSERTGRLLTVFLCLFIVSACNQGDSPLDSTATASDESISAAVVDFAIDADAVTDDVLATESEGTSAASVIERSFSRTRSCPVSGEMSVMGSFTRTADHETGVVELLASGGRTASDCAFPHEENIVTVNGSSEWDLFRRRVNGQPDGLQTSNYAGMWTASSSTGAERNCSFAFSAVRDPAANTITVEGTFCGNRIRRVLGWNRD